jgi:hypothetical protein
MLKPKPPKVSLDDTTWRTLMKDILYATKQKISILKNMISLNLDEYVIAGLYTFVLEEFGKLILLSNSLITNSAREIVYFKGFSDHKAKFEASLNYLQSNKFEESYILNDKGSYSPKSYSWKSFTIGQLVDFDTRLSLFYSDLDKDPQSGNLTISKMPFIDKAFLKTAVLTFEKAVNAYNLPP